MKTAQCAGFSKGVFSGLYRWRLLRRDPIGCDVCYSVLPYDDGTTVNLGISFALPENYPAMGHASGVRAGDGGRRSSSKQHRPQ